jgi:hypothetical protein
MSSKEIYVSTDVEADGPIPGPNSMLSFGSAAYTRKTAQSARLKSHRREIGFEIPLDGFCRA